MATAIARSLEKEILKKPHAALVMVPRLGKLTPISRKMYSVLLYKTQFQIGELANQGTLVNSDHFFSASLVDITSSFTAGESDPKTLAKKYLKEMRRTEVDWEAPDAGTNVVWRSMGLLSEVALETKNGDVWVSWALPPSLFKAIADPASGYAPIDLSQMAKLTSYTAIALYDICIRYKYNPTGLTSMNPPDWWVDALTNTPAPIDPATGERLRREWRKLKSASVGQAIEEINGRTDIAIALIESKTGKAVTGVQFSVIANKTSNPANSMPQVSAELAVRAAQIDISVNTVARLIKNGSTEEEVRFGLAKLDKRLQKKELEPVDNKSAYLRSVVSDAQGRIAPVQPRSAVGNVLLVVEEVKPWKEQRRADVKAEFLQLFKEEQKNYVDAAVVVLKSKGIASPAMLRKVAEGNWNTGTLLSAAVEAYAIAIYGDAWLSEQELVAE